MGASWFALLYFVGGLGGALGSILLNRGDVLSVGASGAIMGVLTSALVLSFHIACYDRRKRIRWVSLRILVPALLPVTAAAGGGIDYSGHLGGVIAGLLMGYLLLIFWAEQEPSPPRRPLMAGFAAGIGGFSLLIFVLAAVLPTSAPAEAATPGLIPIDDLPQSALGERRPRR